MIELTRFEKARLISARALQISLGAPALLKADKSMSIYDLAKLEFEKNVLPLTVIREMPSGKTTKMVVA